MEGEEAAQQQQHLTAQESASLLRCLAPAERLPALNYGSLCRRLLRAHAAAASEAGDASQQAAAVETAVVAFTAAQGSRQQQQYHLAELAAELLAPRHLAAAVHAMQLSLLQHLPRLLAALPEAQAADALRGVCQHVSQQAAAAAAGGPGSSGQPWGTLLQLMGSLDLLLDGSSATAPSPSLQAAAQQALLATLLALLPSPGLYPLALLARQPGTGSDKQQQEQRLLSPQQRCWSAALSCLQQLPAKRLEGVLADPTLLRQLPMHAAYAAAALVAAGTLDARSLQHPRNLLLAGSSLPAWQQRRIAAFVGRAVGSLPAERQQQWTLDALDAVKVCASAVLLACSACSSSACRPAHPPPLAVLRPPLPRLATTPQARWLLHPAWLPAPLQQGCRASRWRRATCWSAPPLK